LPDGNSYAHAHINYEKGLLLGDQCREYSNVEAITSDPSG